MADSRQQRRAAERRAKKGTRQEPDVVPVPEPQTGHRSVGSMRVVVPLLALALGASMSADRAGRGKETP